MTMQTKDLVTQITRLHAQENLSQAEARRITDIPISYEAVTPDWMTSVLCAGYPGAAVTSVSLDTRDSGSTNRRRIFLEYNQAGQDAALPASVFCKATQELLNRINLAICGCTHAETVFFNTIRPQLQLETPRAFHAAYDDQSFNSIIVLEDIADGVTFCNYNHSIDYELACSQVDLLAQLHSQFWQHETVNARALKLNTFPEFFHQIERNELEAYCDKGFRASEAIISPRFYRRAGEIWPATVRAVDSQAAWPQTLLQGDCHLKHWYVVDAERRMGLTDWQGACFGEWARDLAYGMATSLRIEDRRNWERDLVSRYLERMRAPGITMPSAEDAWRRYRVNMLPALAFWTVTLTPAPNMPDMQPQAAALEFIERLAAACDDLEAIEAVAQDAG